MSRMKLLVGRGIIVTRVETDKQMNRLTVFWATSRVGEKGEVAAAGAGDGRSQVRPSPKWSVGNFTTTHIFSRRGVKPRERYG